MNPNGKTIIWVLMTALILIGAYIYQKTTAEERAYKAEIRRLMLISEHQRVEIEVAEQGKKLESLKKKPPVIEFSSPAGGTQ